MNESIRIGLIGCGRRLRGVVGNVCKVADGVDVAALCDTHPISLEKAKRELNPDAAVYDSVEALLAESQVSWIFVGSWNCFHADQVVAAFEAGKHVFCEKPLALTVPDCLRMRDAWRQSGKHFSIGFTLRYSPHYVRVKELLDAGAIGRVISLEFNETLDFNHGGYIHADWRRKSSWAGSHLLEKCCHDMDLANWMLNSVPVKAASFGGLDFFVPGQAHHRDRLGGNAEGQRAFETWSGPDLPGNIVDPFNDDKDILDNQVAILQYASGARATFHTNCMSGIPERRMYLCGSEGALRADVISGKIELRRMGFDAPLEDHSTSASGGHGGGDMILARSVADTLFMNTPPRTSLEDGLRAAFAAFGIDRAQETGQVFDLMPFWHEAGIDPVQII